MQARMQRFRAERMSTASSRFSESLEFKSLRPSMCLITKNENPFLVRDRPVRVRDRPGRPQATVRDRPGHPQGMACLVRDRPEKCVVIARSIADHFSGLSRTRRR